MATLGGVLVKESVITDYELSQIEELAKDSNTPIEAVILSEGYSNPLTLYKAIAKYHKLSFANLDSHPCDNEIINESHIKNYKLLKAIPWKKEDDITFIATSKVSQELENWAKNNYGKNYKIVLTSPYDIQLEFSRVFGNEFDRQARESLYENNPLLSAKYLIVKNWFKSLIGIITLSAGIIALNPLHVVTFFFLATNVFYASTLIFKSALLIIGYMRSYIVMAKQKQLEGNNEILPIYTILVPLFKETEVLEKLVNSLREIDYPKSKLDIKLIVEEHDYETINAIKALKCERMFEIIRVPYSIPQTKPKACNYALQYARGEYMVIYDAEDQPDPLQLRKALWLFKNSPDNVVCAQARLKFFNYDDSLITRMFSFEYSNLFDFTLFGLEAMEIPIPLGGTSNHFKMDKLKELYAWDPYNVTEDADLGIRMAQKGWKTKMLDSTTMEEAPITFDIWLKQRTRWIKGHIQTYLVHMRNPLRLLRKLGLTGFFGFQMFLGAPALIFLIAPFMWCIWLILIIAGIELIPFMPEWFKPVLYFSYGVLVFGVWTQIAFALISISRNKYWKKMTPYCLAYPFYWFLHSIASFRAVWHLIKKPHYWEKTTHGVTNKV